MIVAAAAPSSQVAMRAPEPVQVFSTPSHAAECRRSPPALKRRVGGDWGHLNNHQAVQFLSAVGTEGLRHLVVAHVSENNNCLDRARSALSAVIDPTDERVIFADQGDGLEWLSLA